MALITWTDRQFGTNIGFSEKDMKLLYGKLNKLYDLATGGARAFCNRCQVG